MDIIPQNPRIECSLPEFPSKVIRPSVSPGAMNAALAVRLLLPCDPTDEMIAEVIENLSGLKQLRSAIEIAGETEETRLDYLASDLTHMRSAGEMLTGDMLCHLEVLEELLAGLRAGWETATFAGEGEAIG